MRRILIISLATMALLFAFGPRVSLQNAWRDTPLPEDLAGYLSAQESRFPDIRNGDRKEIVWANDASRAVTPISIVYLHGFSADRHEVEPLISELGRELNANVYFTRLTGHARTSEALGSALAENWLDDAAEAFRIGSRIGSRVVVIGSSTGGALAVWLASRPETDGKLAALLLLSPNLGLYDWRAGMLRWPWAKLLTHLITGRQRCIGDEGGYAPSIAQELHWTTCYPSRTLLQVGAVVGLVRNLEPDAITVPVLALFSDIDTTIDTDAGRERLAALSGGNAGSATIGLSAFGEGDGHVIAGDIMAPSAHAQVRSLSLEFLQPLPMSILPPAD